MTTVMIVDDEVDIRAALRVLLTRAGYTVVEAVDGRDALRRFHTDRPDAIILDVGMPQMDGWQTLERLRDISAVPVLLLTARDRETDRVRGLDAGADDYLIKPFGNQELLARVRVLLRRAPSTDSLRERIEDDVLSISMVERTVCVHGEEVSLTPLEFRVLTELAAEPGRVFSEVQLLRQAWEDHSEVAPERVKFVIHRLRRKLASAGAPMDLIASVRGCGYRYRSSRSVVHERTTG